MKQLAFKWWIKDALHRKRYMIKAAHTQYAHCTHRFGIRLPHSVDEALAIDRETNTTYWFDAIQKEMKISGLLSNFWIPANVFLWNISGFDVTLRLMLKWISRVRLDISPGDV